MIGVNTNSYSMSAQKNLTQSMGGLQKSIDRLSSGLRVNSAKDDAAGLAIAERMSAMNRGNEVAKRNSNDGISALQVADGAMSDISNNLQRMRELAAQSATGTLTQSDRSNLDAEFQQLSTEIKRQADTTEFNGVSLLKGNGAGGDFSLQVQIGSGSTESLALGIKDINTAIDTFRSGKADVSVPAKLAGAVTLNDLTPTTVTLTTPKAGFTAYDINGDSTADFQYNTTTGALETLKPDQSVDQTFSVATGGLANVTVSSFAGLDSTGRTSIGSADLQITDNGTNSTVKFTNGNSIGGMTGANAQSAMTKIDTLLNTVNSNRASIGAGINRLDSVVSSLTTKITNMEAARGRIVDADFAAETAKLTRSQILQQAGTAMLAQANQIPNNVLSLLR